MFKRIVWLLVAFPVAIVLITLAVTNREAVPLVLDPFQPPSVVLELPLYAYLFAALVFGVILGGIATWMTQGRWRRAARDRAAEARKWKAEADRLIRERDANILAGRGTQLAAPDGKGSAAA